MLRSLWRIRVEVNVHPEYVELACAGLFSRSEAFRVNDEAFRRAATESRRNILIDARRVVGRVPTILDRYEIGVNIARSYLDQLPRIRLALLGHEPMIHPERFGEIVARNRGADTRVFTDEAEAIRWLVAA
jgi:hypothetical protein